jgi:hypothetical protein
MFMNLTGEEFSSNSRHFLRNYDNLPIISHRQILAQYAVQRRRPKHPWPAPQTSELASELPPRTFLLAGNFAISTPRLWNSIDIRVDYSGRSRDTYPKCLSTKLERSGQVPLCIIQNFRCSALNGHLNILRSIF